MIKDDILLLSIFFPQVRATSLGGQKWRVNELALFRTPNCTDLATIISDGIIDLGGIRPISSGYSVIEGYEETEFAPGRAFDLQANNRIAI